MDSNALSKSDRGALTPHQGRFWAVLAAFIIVAGALLASASQPGSALAGSVVRIAILPSTAQVAAGTAQTYTVEGFNSRGRSVGDVTADTAFTTTPASGGTATPCTANNCGPTTAGAYTVTATYSGVAPVTAALTVVPGPAANAVFSHPPIATEKVTPIYSACRPPSGATTAPCAPSGLGANDSTAVRVLVTDLYGNRILSQSVQVSATKLVTPPTTALVGDAVQTVDGVAAFGDALSIAAVGEYTLSAQVTSGPAANRPSTAGVAVAIVNDLQACTGSSCANNANNGAAVAQKLQRAYGEVTATPGSTFYGDGKNVLLTTRFAPGAETDRCSSATIGDAVDLTVSGAGTSATAPSTEMLLVMPREALKFYGIASRGTGTFNVCLGALNISGGGVTEWQQKTIFRKAVVLAPSTPILDPNLGVDRYWGVPADCGTPLLPPKDPCIALRTKNVGQVQSHLGLTADEVAAIGIRDSDLMIVISKQSPWDGKAGIY